MKKYITTFLLLFIPFMSMAADHCTNPEEYTVDKRCYVTDEQKKTKPYNATVALKTFWGTYCTGTIAKWNRGLTNTDFSGLDDLFYLFTAKHCTDHNDDNVPDKTLKIKLQNGNTFDVTLVGYGNRDIKKDTNWAGDWAVYRLPVDLIKDLSGNYHVNTVSAENMEKDINWVYADAGAKRDNRSIVKVGYGALKIMSDKDIEKFRQRYLNYLERKGINREEKDVGIGGDNSINTKDETVKKFINSLRMMFASLDIFEDGKLKSSKCNFSSHSYCQNWSGDSGGSVFDNENRLVGVQTRGYKYIGGKDHARLGDEVPTGYIYQEMNKSDFVSGLFYEEKPKE